MYAEKPQIVLVRFSGDSLHLARLRILNRYHFFAALVQPTGQEKIIEYGPSRLWNRSLLRREGIAFPNPRIALDFEPSRNLLRERAGNVPPEQDGERTRRMVRRPLCLSYVT